MQTLIFLVGFESHTSSSHTSKGRVEEEEEKAKRETEESGSSSPVSS